jgi:hypothetical protein
LRNNQKDYAKYLLQTNAEGNNRVVQYINANTAQIVRGDIPSIFKYINDISGYDAIHFDLDNLLVNTSSSSSPSSSSSSSSKSVYVYNIKDNDLQKQLQIKQLRDAAKEQRGTFTKANIAKRIRQYRYLPPDPRTNFFERNVNEATKFREIKPVLEFIRTIYTKPSVDLGSKKN